MKAPLRTLWLARRILWAAPGVLMSIATLPAEAQVRNCTKEYQRHLDSERASYEAAVRDTKKQGWAFLPSDIAKELKKLEDAHQAALRMYKEMYNECCKVAAQQQKEREAEEARKKALAEERAKKEAKTRQGAEIAREGAPDARAAEQARDPRKSASEQLSSKSEKTAPPAKDHVKPKNTEDTAAQRDRLQRKLDRLEARVRMLQNFLDGANRRFVGGRYISDPNARFDPDEYKEFQRMNSKGLGGGRGSTDQELHDVWVAYLEGELSSGQSQVDQVRNTLVQTPVDVSTGRNERSQVPVGSGKASGSRSDHVVSVPASGEGSGDSSDRQASAGTAQNIVDELRKDDRKAIEDILKAKDLVEKVEALKKMRDRTTNYIVDHIQRGIQRQIDNPLGNSPPARNEKSGASGGYPSFVRPDSPPAYPVPDTPDLVPVQPVPIEPSPSVRAPTVTTSPDGKPLRWWRDLLPDAPKDATPTPTPTPQTKDLFK